MKTQTIYKNNKKLRNVNEIGTILYLLKVNGFTQRDIAKDLGISKSAVYRSIYGLSKITRVDDWLQDNIGLKFDCSGEKG